MRQPHFYLYFIFFFSRRFCCSEPFIYLVRAVECGKVNHHNGYAKQHIPEPVRYNIVEKLEQRVRLVEDGEHIVHLHNLARPVEYVICNTVLVDKNVDKVNCYVSTQSNSQCGPDALFIELYKLEFEKNKRYAKFQHVGEIVEYKNPACNFRHRHRSVEHKRRKRAYGPKHKQVAKVLVACKHNDWK